MTSLVCSDPSKMVCSDPPRMVCSDPYKVGGSLQTILEGSLQTKDVIDGAGCMYVNLKLNTSADKISYSLTQFVDSPIYCQLLFYFGLVTFLDLRGKSPISECEKVFFAS